MDDAENPTQSDVLVQATLREICVVLEEEIDRLPVVYREPFVLCCLEYLSSVEVAIRLGVTEAVVRNRLCRARKMLRERLTRRGASTRTARQQWTCNRPTCNNPIPTRPTIRRAARFTRHAKSV